MASRGHPPSPGCCFGMDRGPAGVRWKKAPVQHGLITPNTAASTWRLHRTPLSLWAIFETLVTQSQLHTKHNNLIKFMLNWLVCSILITFTVTESVRLLHAWVMMLFNSNILSSSWKAALIPHSSTSAYIPWTDLTKTWQSAEAQGSWSQVLELTGLVFWGDFFYKQA